MSDSYQAVYDAVRSKISSDICLELVDVARNAFDLSAFAEEVSIEHRRPSAVYRPSIKMDGDKWSALYGDNLQDGVAGFGDTPAAAMADFDRAWNEPIRRI